MCGIVGINAFKNINQELFDALTVLQHRGQDAAGIVTIKNSQFFMRKANGLVHDVFRTRHIQHLTGNLGIGHVRYPTSGTSSIAEAQPFYVNSPYGIALAHNGNLTNTNTIKKDLFETDFRHINTTSDSEILLNVLANELSKVAHKSLSANDIFMAIHQLYKHCQGGYAAISIINGFGMIAFRDPYGIRPLIYGKKKTDKGTEYIFASESVAITALGYEIVRDLQPGECIYVDQHNQLHYKKILNYKQHSCLFEYVYFARPDSIIDQVSVYQARLQMGKMLAEKISQVWENHNIDVVIPIPDTSRSSALEIANTLKIPYREGLVKNRYIGRTFIMPGQEIRDKSVKQKLNPINQEFKNKNILLVDDSIVRGTTSKQIIQMARKAGAKKVYFCSAAPVIRHPNVYGIDMPTHKELISHNRSIKEIEKFIGSDHLIYQTLEDLKNTITTLNPQLKTFDCSVFDGHYITGNIEHAYFVELAKNKRNTDQNIEKNNSSLNIYNDN